MAWMPTATGSRARATGRLGICYRSCGPSQASPSPRGASGSYATVRSDGASVCPCHADCHVGVRPCLLWSRLITGGKGDIVRGACEVCGTRLNIRERIVKSRLICGPCEAFEADARNTTRVEYPAASRVVVRVSQPPSRQGPAAEGDESAREFEPTPAKAGISRGLVFMLALGLAVPLSCAVLGTPAPAVTRPVPVTQAAATVGASTANLTGETKADLGTRPFGFGSQGQARELLALIEANPGKARYTITYRTDADVVVFSADLAKGVMVRIHRYPADGTSETWTGYVLERLQNGARGGSLNDTPAGKLPGDYRTN